MKNNFFSKIILPLFVFFVIIVTISCNFFPLDEALTDEEKLIMDGYTLLEIEAVDGVWYKNIDEEVTRYILQDEISHSTQYYLDLYLFIEINTSNEPSLVLKSRTNSSSLGDMFIPNYVTYQPFGYNSTSSSEKITLLWGSVDYQRYTGADDYSLWCNSTVLNDGDTILNFLIDMFDIENDIYYYFSNNIYETNVKHLTSELKKRISDTLLVYVNHKDELKYHAPGDIPLYNNISFHANGGEGSMDKATLNLNESLYLPANSFTKKGYTFSGWSTSSGGSITYYNESSYTMGAIGVNLYAQWIPNSNTITFHVNYPCEESTLTQNINTDASAYLQANSFTREGCYFAGWSTSSAGDILFEDEENFTMGTTNVDLYAQWRMKFVASDLTDGDFFGQSVAISEKYAIVGSINDDDNGEQSGSAYIYHYDSLKGIWVQEQKIYASDGTSDDCFGYSVGISGNHIIIGSIHDDDNGRNSGSAYIYTIGANSIETMSSEQKLIAFSGIPNQEYGYSVGISNTNVIVGSRRENGTGVYYGGVYVYELSNDGINTKSSEQLLTGGYYERFGWSVAISESTCIVGSTFGDGNVRTSGVAYVFQIEENIEDTLNSKQKIYGSDGKYVDSFGQSVAISGKYAIVGSIYDDDNGEQSGSAYIYHYDSLKGIWVQEQKIYTSDGTSGDCFGNSVGISDNLVIVGSIYDDDNDHNSGSAYIYTIGDNSTKTMSSEKKLISYDGKSNDNFGQSVAVSEDFAIIGAPLNDNNEMPNSGSIYFYRL